MKQRYAKATCTMVGFALLVMTSTVVADDVEILLDDTTLGATIEGGDSVTSDGLTMTVTDVVTTNGGSSGDVEGVGILCGTEDTSSDVESLDISFNVDVRITGYIIGGREDIPAGASLTISGPTGTSDANPIPAISGGTQNEVELPFQNGGLVVLKAGQVYTLSHNLDTLVGGDPLFNLEAILVTPLYISIQRQAGMIQLEYVGILQEFSQANGWEDLNPQPSNQWVFPPSGGARLFRARQ